jgi:hypothetical protein
MRPGRHGKLGKLLLKSMLVLSIALSAATTVAATSDAEIEYLLSAVGSSGCMFVRNGTEHPPAEAESHLRMKYRKGARYVSNANDFITRIASKSSWSGKPYQILCPGNEPQPSSQWLNEQLSRHRADISPSG